GVRGVHGGAHREGLVRSSVGHRGRIGGRNHHRGWRAVDRAIIDDELHRVGARPIYGKGWRDAGGIGQRGRAIRGPAREAPGKGERIAIHIVGATAIERSEERRVGGQGGSAVGARGGVGGR